jgi:hypothetical protein
MRYAKAWFFLFTIGTPLVDDVAETLMRPLFCALCAINWFTGLCAEAWFFFLAIGTALGFNVAEPFVRPLTRAAGTIDWLT